MRSKKSKIPEFKTVAEEAHFWDTHSFVDFEDELEDVDIVFDLEKNNQDAETLIVPVEKKVKARLEKIAKVRGVDAANLVSSWLTKKLQANK